VRVRDHGGPHRRARHHPAPDQGDLGALPEGGTVGRVGQHQRRTAVLLHEAAVDRVGDGDQRCRGRRGARDEQPHGRDPAGTGTRRARLAHQAPAARPHPVADADEDQRGTDDAHALEQVQPQRAGEGDQIQRERHAGEAERHRPARPGQLALVTAASEEGLGQEAAGVRHRPVAQMRDVQVGHQGDVAVELHERQQVEQAGDVGGDGEDECRVPQGSAGERRREGRGPGDDRLRDDPREGDLHPLPLVREPPAVRDVAEEGGGEVEEHHAHPAGASSVVREDGTVAQLVQRGGEHRRAGQRHQQAEREGLAERAVQGRRLHREGGQAADGQEQRQGRAEPVREQREQRGEPLQQPLRPEHRELEGERRHELEPGAALLAYPAVVEEPLPVEALDRPADLARRPRSAQRTGQVRVVACAVHRAQQPDHVGTDPDVLLRAALHHPGRAVRDRLVHQHVRGEPRAGQQFGAHPGGGLGARPERCPLPEQGPHSTSRPRNSLRATHPAAASQAAMTTNASGSESSSGLPSR